MFHRTTADPSLRRGITQQRLGRRDALRIGGLSALGAALAACGVPGQTRPEAASSSGLATFWEGRKQNGTVDFANWPLYMDPSKPELAKFTGRTGITVNYEEVIQEMGPWFAKVQPQLSAGKPIGYDLMVITNGIQFGRFRSAGFLAPLDHTRLPNFTANAAAKYTEESFDPANVFSVPWASGITGIAYDPDKVDGPITSLADLWNPRYRGKVGMMSDTTELANFGMLAAGITPGRSTEADWSKAAAQLRRQKDAGIVRNYYEQDYLDALGKGEIWISQAWSGDIFQKNISDGTNLKFVIPDEGGTLWTDNLAIPVTAANPVDAITLIDFFYEVENAASLAGYINYVCPVPAAQEQMRKDAATRSGDDRTTLEAVANSSLVFPSDADYARLHHYASFNTAEEQQTFAKIFDPIVLS
ncbi:spermidine/putrescine transport system substrate-binding protein [Actinoplanes campanulatus]|uniref:Spermidine/putrescine transport system substrate-binding protein n=1 Tax=Actinoplanes campanulatus TaxID=113559 RepID=A0A7W5FDI2_9ACTN|nr:spermidine/putrescine ABC transporter substrate-binding protein [Actinoplanes campanulatus]MBB3094508.1 spermidine/putrescine transport system substrate-binding protein [Actinoplanes campanulatus]GGN21535.1 ABC transporter substrate-binding protein [Actinoplanes campanulatus]GID35577.1 ABC transporter substrate-binding protein [Actinoplanes campanulatus]